MNWIDGLTEEQKRKAGLLPEQRRERARRQLEVLRSAMDCPEKRQLEGALKRVAGA